jgi:hypothetical protein
MLRRLGDTHGAVSLSLLAPVEPGAETGDEREQSMPRR